MHEQTAIGAAWALKHVALNPDATTRLVQGYRWHRYRNRQWPADIALATARRDLAQGKIRYAGAGAGDSRP